MDTSTIAAAAVLAAFPILTLTIGRLIPSDGVGFVDLFPSTTDRGRPRRVPEEDLVPWRVELLRPWRPDRNAEANAPTRLLDGSSHRAPRRVQNSSI